jgi:hypothetical protein
MVAMCKETVTNVASLNLLGEALRETAADMCTQDFAGVLHKSPTTPSIAKGCNLFADKLVDAYSKGPVDKSAFCSSLAQTKTKQALSQQTRVPAVASKAKPTKRKVHVKKPSVSLLRQRQTDEVEQSEGDEASLLHGSEMDSGSFLNSFLDDYDGKQDATNGNGADNEDTSPAIASSADADETEATDEDTAKNSKGASDEDTSPPIASLADVDNTDSTDEEVVKNDKGASNEDTSPTISSSADVDDTKATDEEVAKAPVASSSQGDADVDSLVSSFLQKDSDPV